MQDPFQQELLRQLQQLQKTLKGLTVAIVLSATVIVISLNPAFSAIATTLVVVAGIAFLILYLMYVVFGGLGWGIGNLIAKWRR